MKNFFPKSISKEGIKKIYEQLDNLIYKINEKDSNLGIGFFCYIKYKDKKIPALIISNCEISGKKYIKEINISNNDISKQIQLGETRFIDKKNNLMLFEVKLNKKDKINFIEIDNLIFCPNSEQFYYQKSIYIIQSGNKFKNSYASFGTIDIVNKSHFLYYANLSSNIKGFPILDLLNNKLIGIHESVDGHYCKGKFLNYAFKEFLIRYKINQKNEIKKTLKNENEINIVVKVNKTDIGKKIFFLDNYSNKDKEESESDSDYINHLKQLTNSNTKLTINKEQKEFTNFLIPEKIGKYNINLKFDINLTDCSYMFAECEKIESINFISFNTKNV